MLWPIWSVWRYCLPRCSSTAMSGLSAQAGAMRRASIWFCRNLCLCSQSSEAIRQLCHSRPTRSTTCSRSPGCASSENLPRLITMLSPPLTLPEKSCRQRCFSNRCQTNSSTFRSITGPLTLTNRKSLCSSPATIWRSIISVSPRRAACLS